MVGESFGGVVAQHFALRHPDWLRSATFISSLCHTELNWVVRFKATFVLPLVKGFGRALPGLAQQLFALFHADDEVLAPADEEACAGAGGAGAGAPGYDQTSSSCN